MKKYCLIVACLVGLLSMASHARDDALFLSIEEAMTTADFKEKLDPDIRFYWGEQSHPKPSETLGEFVSNKKTNAFGKSDQRACRWALLSALLSFQDRVRAEGGNAVVGLTSYYKKNEFSSETEFECHAGSVIAGVALQGQVVTLP